MLGYFSLNVPSGLTLYWFTNNVLSTAQQAYLRGSVSAAADDKNSASSSTASFVGKQENAPIEAEFTSASTSSSPPAKKKSIPLPPSAVMDEFPGMSNGSPKAPSTTSAST